MRVKVVGLAVTVAVMLPMLVPAPALGIPDPDCENASYNVQVTQGTQVGNHQGVRGNTWFGASFSYSADP